MILTFIVYNAVNLLKYREIRFDKDLLDFAREHTSVTMISCANFHKNRCE